MAITSSAKKAHRASLRKRVFNLRRKKAIEIVMKQVKKLIAEKKMGEAQKLMPSIFQALDKAAKEHTIPKGRADRKKSRLARMVVSTAP